MDHSVVKATLDTWFSVELLSSRGASRSHLFMPFDSSQHGAADPALAPGIGARRTPKRLLGGVEWQVAVLALAIAGSLIAGLAWNLRHNQAQGREYLDDAITRRAGLTAEVIASALTNAETPASARAK